MTQSLTQLQFAAAFIGRTGAVMPAGGLGIITTGTTTTQSLRTGIG